MFFHLPVSVPLKIPFTENEDDFLKADDRKYLPSDESKRLLSFTINAAKVKISFST